jgi:DNA recombination protein RmuC
MFLPAESVYATIHSDFADVVDRAFKARVMIVSPTTFMATLHTMRAVMKDALLREQAGEVQKIVELLRRDIELVDERVDKLQKHHDKSAELMVDLRKNADRAIGRSERIAALELGDDEPEAITPPHKPELLQGEPVTSDDEDEQSSLAV